MQNKIKFILPFIILFSLFGLLYREIFLATPTHQTPGLVGEPLPQFNLPTLSGTSTQLNNRDLSKGVVLLNVWASWCYACQLEMPMLLKIKSEFQIPIYGINYKDNKAEAIAWLEKFGDPYTVTGLDTSGDTAIDLGIYGAPETFIVKDGKIIYRHIGIIDENNWAKVLYPIIQRERRS